MFPRIFLVTVICVMAGCQTDRLARIDQEAGQVPARLPEVSHASKPVVEPVAFVEPVDELLMPESVVVANSTSEPNVLPLAQLTLEELEQMAMIGNPSLAEARARVRALHGKWTQVGLPPNAVLGYSGQQLGSGGQAEQHGLYIGQEFVRGGKLRLSRAVVCQEIEKAEQEWAAQQLRVRTDVRLGYYEVLVSQQRNTVASEIVEIAEQAVATAEALFRAKEVSKVDVMRARTELQKSQLGQSNAHNQATGAWARLVVVLGNQELQPRPLSGNVESVADDLIIDEVLSQLISESPEIAAAMSEVQRTRRAVQRACAEPISNVDVQAVVQSDNGTNSSNANLQVSMAIPWLNRNQGGICQAQAEVIEAERAVDRLELSLAQRLATVFQRYANARNQVEEYSKEDGILANSKATLDLVRKGYEAGELSYLDLNTAQRTFSRTNLANIEALGQLWAARVEIEGFLLKGSLGN